MKMKVDLEKTLSRRILLADGAMGTMLYERGVFLNSCFDELNLSNPAMVEDIHQAYIEAGADFIETNSFGANEFKLGKFGLAEKVVEINKAAVGIAKKAAKSGVMVAGAMGPLGFAVTEHSRLPAERAHEAFRVQARALAEAGADFLILETFSSTDELLIAIRAAEATGLAIIAQMTVNEHSETLYGERIDQAISRISAERAVTVVGLNCSVGPSDMLTSLELIQPVTQKPISVQPNAGLPRQVEDRTLYMCTPEYMAEYAKRFYEKGARIIGGCCGTTPNHTREIVRAVRSLDRAAGQRPKVAATAFVPAAAPEKAVKAVPVAEKSAFGAKIAAGLPVTSIELTPPKGMDLSATIEKARICAEHGVDAINIPDGPRASSRLSPMVTAVRIQQEAGIEAILHFCCRDRNLIGMQSDLLGAAAIGLKNMLIITGDPPKLGDYPNATGVFDMDSIALAGVLHNLNRGLDIGGNPFSPPTAMTIGVGANPVATDLRREIDKFRQKVIAGAEYAITQPVFDAQMLFDFLDAIEDFRIPIIAGIWPFTSYKNAEFMANEVPGVVVPEELLARMSTASTKEQARALGIEIAREMIEKISERVAGFAVSAPFGNVRTALAVLSKIEINAA